ncbi:GAF domain-containing sensor histidine kinase [Deinococcus apachensis]|uniref:GAF domain-containing sensor histidine kinase n=1 Tax=Deinococcus apachensis TaxID=309886 RepID=UPI0003A9B30A|nr:GAF domain-containing protein [Deinococcus apachensis]
MSRPPGSFTLHSERLQDVAEALTAARTPEDVLGVILAALEASTGALLRVEAGAYRLDLAATRGDGVGLQGLWQEGPLRQETPAGEALRQREPLLLGGGDHPEEETAAVLLPLFLGGEPCGVVALTFTRERHLTGEERRLLQTLAALGALALGRTRGSAAQERTEALDAFVAFAERVDGETDVQALITRAADVLNATLGEVSVAYYEPEGDLWRARVWSEEVPPDFIARMRAGFPRDTPRFAEAVRGRQPHFLAVWDPVPENLPGTRAYAAMATYPYFRGDEPRAVLSVGTPARPGWTAREQAVIRAVGRSLGLALERAEQTRRLEEERAALEAFVALTQAVGAETDVLALAGRAIQVLRATFAQGSVGYYEREGDVWKGRVGSGDSPEPLRRVIEVGLPGGTPIIARMLRAREPVFVEGWDAVREHVPRSGGVGAVACYPLTVNGEVGSFLAAALHDARQWSERERAVFRAVGDSLRLALERTATAGQLRAQKDELERRNRVLEAFAELARDLAFETDPYALVRRAQELVLTLLPPGFSGYHELGDGLWRLRSLVGDPRSPGVRAAFEHGLPFGETRSLSLPWASGQPLYREVHDPDLDGQPTLTEPFGAAATLPVKVGGAVRGVLGVGLFDPHVWSGADRAALETVAYSLGLALERAEQARELEERTRALAAANEELEAFAYSVSHDLRTPVRHIGSFNDLLRRSLGDHLDDRTARYLGIVDEATRRMNTLIDAMLDLSRTSRLPLRPAPVDLGELVAAVRAELEPDESGRRVVWRVAPLPPVTGDPGTLRQVMVNLLGNALKYTRTRDPAQVEVWAEERPGEWAVFVRDNGVGFDPRYTDKLFGVFQRLHRFEEFEGTGVGLANVRRIINRHGGTVFAQGIPGEGATFGFTLPRPR